jgi:hypothetical protein
MRRFALILGICIISAIGLVRPAAAQIQFNCAMLSGSPFMCLKNESNKPIVAVQAVAPGGGWYNESAWINIPGGGVMPGGAAVIKFPAYKGCTQTVVVKTADGQPHYFWNVNVCQSTSITIRW